MSAHHRWTQLSTSHFLLLHRSHLARRQRVKLRCFQVRGVVVDARLVVEARAVIRRSRAQLARILSDLDFCRYIGIHNVEAGRRIDVQVRRVEDFGILACLDRIELLLQTFFD